MKPVLDQERALAFARQVLEKMDIGSLTLERDEKGEFALYLGEWASQEDLIALVRLVEPFEDVHIRFTYKGLVLEGIEA